MHGSICVILKKFVEQNFGRDVWLEILRLAGHEGLVLSPIQSYPDEAVFAIVGATCERLELDMPTALEAVGKFAAPELIRFARGMLHPDWKTFELLANIETLIHRTIRVSNPGAEPASIQAFELSDDQVQVVYSSQRGLCALANGILQGLGDVFDEDLTVVENTCTHKGDPFCTFTITKASQLVPALAGAGDTVGVSSSSVAVEDSKNPLSDPYGMTSEIGEAEAAQNEGTETPVNVSSGATGAKFVYTGKTERSSDGDTKHGLPSSSTIIPLPKRIGRYSIHEVLGLGGMGIVYRGIDETLMRTVAIKTLKNVKTESEKKEQFLAEARRLAKLSHPNVVQIYDVGKVAQRPYFVMEFLEGLTLASRLSRGPMTLAGALRIFRQLLEGLHAIHRLGIVHRDIKPGNVMLSSDLRHCQLLDFGLAGDEAQMSSSGGSAVSGTRGYLPPERLKGYPGDYRSDFFSLGCVAYEMLSGKMLHQLRHFDSDNRLYLKVIDETPQWLEAPEPLRAIVLGMLHPVPEERLCDYSQINEVIERYHSGPDSSDNPRDFSI
jgi:predicted hydrocarbon binding protein